MFSGFGRDLESSKKSDFVPNRHFENPSRKKENFPRSQSKVNGFAADNYSSFNLRRKQQKKTQPFYEPPNEWSSDKRPDRPRVNFVNPDDSKGDDGNWRAHKASKVSVPKVIKKVEEKPLPEKNIISAENIPSMVINARVNPTPLQNVPEKVPGYGNRKREEKKVTNKITSSILMGYERLPPRFRKKFCEDNHVTMEEVEAYLTNGLPSQDDHNSKQHSTYQSRSQTLPQRSDKGRSNEPQRHHEQVFYRTKSNQPPAKTEARRVQSISSSESSRRDLDFDTQNFSNHEEPKVVDSVPKNNTEDISINMKQPIESAILLPSGTIVCIFLFFYYVLKDLFINFNYENF